MSTPKYVNILLSFVLLTESLAASDLSQWSNVFSLKSAQKVGVIQADLKRVEGRFLSATDSSITLDVNGALQVNKDQVVRVYRPTKLNRAASAAIGAGIGVAIAAVLMGTIGRRLENDGGQLGDIDDAGWYGIGIGAGAGIGALTGGRPKVVYQRK